MSGKELCRTPYVYNNIDPKWLHCCALPDEDAFGYAWFSVFDMDTLKSEGDYLGAAGLSMLNNTGNVELVLEGSNLPGADCARTALSASRPGDEPGSAKPGSARRKARRPSQARRHQSAAHARGWRSLVPWSRLGRHCNAALPGHSFRTCGSSHLRLCSHTHRPCVPLGDSTGRPSLLNVFVSHAPPPPAPPASPPSPAPPPAQRWLCVMEAEGLPQTDFWPKMGNDLLPDT